LQARIRPTTGLMVWTAAPCTTRIRRTMSPSRLARQPESGRVPPHGDAGNPCAICTVRLFSVCGALQTAELPRLANIAKSHTVEPRTTFVNEGDPSQHLFNLTEGVAKLYKVLSDGRRQITGFLYPGDFLGLVAGGKYSCSAAAVTRVTFCRFERPQLDKLLEEIPRMEHRLLGIASRELAAAQEQMLLLGRKSAPEKLATFLIMLSRRSGRSGSPAQPLVLAMTRYDIGDFLGLTVETVSRMLTQFRKEGLIELPTSDRVVLRERPALEALAEAA
jgi:CRP/FNR family transcriptional regulator